MFGLLDELSVVIPFPVACQVPETVAIPLGPVSFFCRFTLLVSAAGFAPAVTFTSVEITSRADTPRMKTTLPAGAETSIEVVPLGKSVGAAPPLTRLPLGRTYALKETASEGSPPPPDESSI